MVCGMLTRLLPITPLLIVLLLPACDESFGGIADLTGTERGESERSQQAARDEAREQGSRTADEQCRASTMLPATRVEFRRAECWVTETFLYVCEVRWKAWCVDRLDEF